MVTGKPLGERVARLEVYYAEIPGYLKEIKERLDTLNGGVAENTKFRTQQKAVYAVLAFAWGSLLLPLATIAIVMVR